MTQEFYFKNAKWVGAKERTPKTFSVLRGKFELKEFNKVNLNILGLGFFKCYINGKCINPDTFLPLSSDFEAGCDPIDEVISAHRIYVPQFDITPFVKDGQNTIAIHYGGGWYTFRNRCFGLPKAIYCITAETENGTIDFDSDENCKIGKSFVEEYEFNQGEHQNFLDYEDCLGEDFDDSIWGNAVLTEELITEYCTTDCPIDKLIEERAVKVIKETENSVVYDCGENTTGYPVLEINAPKGGKIIVNFSEECLPDGSIDPEHVQDQQFSFVSDGKTGFIRRIGENFLNFLQAGRGHHEGAGPAGGRVEMEGPAGQTEAVHGDGGNSGILHLEFHTGMDGPALIFGHGEDGSADQLLQSVLGHINGAAHIDVGQFGVILGVLGGDGEGGVAGADRHLIALVHHNGDGAFRQTADDVAEELGGQDAHTGVGNLGVDGVGNGGFHIVARQAQVHAGAAEDALDDGKTALLSHRPGGNVQAGQEHAFFTGKAHRDSSFLDYLQDIYISR